jgi:DNA-binding response OmpR family regulator
MPEKILVVDDEPAIVNSLKGILQRYGYQIITAQNGEECLKQALAEKPDLILLDIMMPKMDGYGFLVSYKELREIADEDSPLPDIPVIIVSARDDATARELVGKENIKDYILKPFDLQDLLTRIKTVLKKD